MAAKKLRRRARRLRRRVLRLEELDLFRQQELRDTAAHLADAVRRHREQRDMTLAVADRLYLCFEILARRAERKTWTVTEIDYPLE